MSCMCARFAVAALLASTSASPAAAAAAAPYAPSPPELVAEMAELRGHLARHPDDPAALSHLGLDSLRAGDASAALDLFERVARAALRLPAGTSVANLDGLYFHLGALVGIQSGLHCGRVLRLPLDETLGAVREVQVLETYNPLFESPTTGTFDGNTFYSIANSQLRKLGPGNAPPPDTQMQDVRILALDIP